MSQSCKYFMIPFDKVLDSPSYTVWYAAWSSTRPTLEPGMSHPMVVGVTTDELPKGAILLAESTKDPQPPPPPPPPSASVSDYESSVEAWLAGGKDD